MASAPSTSHEELRLALVMNGGVSLAVWMGGVCHEIHRVVTQRHPVYAQLLDMTSTVARVDVISGTSAGGVNGAALALALLYGGDFSKLRKVWLDTGAFSDLLRPPTGDNPGSLLQGDEFFLPHIEDAFRELVPEGPLALADSERMPMDLRLTTTLLTGVQGHNVDDLGTPLHDVDYRAYFQFVHKNSASHFKDPADLVPKLARAARSTASFPFAFEPSQVTKDDAGPHLHNAHEPQMALPRFVIDGGILDNKPFQGAREAIFGMKTHGGVRRVLAYVNPDPGDGPPGKIGGDVPPLSRVVVEGLFEIPQSQTIADQLAAITEHNDAVRTRKDSVVSIARLGDKRLDVLPGQLYDAYRRRRLSSTFDLFVFKPLSDAARHNPDQAAGLRVLGKSVRQQMRLAFLDYGNRGLPGEDDAEKDGDPVDPAVPNESLDWLPGAWPASPYHDEGFDPATWKWGLFPVEFGGKLLLDMLRLTQKLVELTDPPPPDEHALADAPHEIDPALDADEPYDPVPLDPDARPEATSSPDDSWSDPDQSPPVRASSRDDRLAGFWKHTLDQLDLLDKRRRNEQRFWDVGTRKLLQLLARYARHEFDPDHWWDALVREAYPDMFSFLSKPERVRFCGDRAYAIAEILGALSAVALQEIEKADRRALRLRALEKDLRDRLKFLARRFAYKDLPTILYRVMQLEVIEFTFNDHEKLNTDTNIELVQISGNSTSPLGGRSGAKDKLLGLQLAHFGAFYKKSWRANDWLYGRLAGAERMVKILVNPERIHRRYFGRVNPIDDAIAEIRDIAVDSVASDRLRHKLGQAWASEDYARHIADELCFLRSENFPLPDTLPYTTRAITARLHFGILAEELPELIGAINQDQADGAANDGPGEAMLRDLGAQARRRDAAGAPAVAPSITPELAQRWLQNDLLGRETLLGQAGSDMFTRTLAHTAATLQNTMASKASHLGPLSALFAAVKLPILGFFFATRGLLGQSRTAAALNGGAMALGLALVLVGFFWSPADRIDGAFPHAMVSLGWALLAYSFIVSALRNAFSVVAGVIAVLLTLGVYSHLHEGLDSDAMWMTSAALVVILALWLSTRLVWMQWVLAVLLFAFAAAWTSGFLHALHGIAYTDLHGYLHDAGRAALDATPVLYFAVALFVALAVEALQASTLGLWTKGFWARRRHGRFVHAYGGEMYLTIRPNWRGAIATIRVAEVPSLGPAEKAGFVTGDDVFQIDGRDVAGMAIREFEQRLRGASPAILLVSRIDDGAAREYPLAAPVVTGSRDDA